MEDRKISFVCGLVDLDHFKGKLPTYLVSLTMIGFDATLLVQHQLVNKCYRSGTVNSKSFVGKDLSGNLN